MNASSRNQHSLHDCLDLHTHEEEEEEEEESEFCRAAAASPCKEFQEEGGESLGGQGSRMVQVAAQVSHERLPVSPTLMYAYASCHSMCHRHQECNAGREEDKREARGIGEQTQTPAPVFYANLSLA